MEGRKTEAEIVEASQPDADDQAHRLSRRRLLGGALAAGPALAALHEVVPHQGLHDALGGNQHHDAIAAAAGVSKRTLYNHFASKEALFRALAAEMGERVSVSAASAALAGSDAQPKRKRLRLCAA